MVSTVNTYKISEIEGIEYNNFNEVKINEIAYLDFDDLLDSNYGGYYDEDSYNTYQHEIRPNFKKFMKQCDCFIYLRSYRGVPDLSDVDFDGEDEEDDFDIFDYIVDYNHYDTHILFRSKTDGSKVFEYVTNPTIDSVVYTINHNNNEMNIMKGFTSELWSFIDLTLTSYGGIMLKTVEQYIEDTQFDLTKQITNQHLTIDLISEIGKYIFNEYTLRDQIRQNKLFLH